MTRNLFIFGCSGIGKSIVDSIHRTNISLYNEIYFVDIEPNIIGDTFYGHPVLGLKNLKEIRTQNQHVIFAFFKPKDIFSRENLIDETIERYEFDLITVVDPRASVSPSAKIGKGCYIGPFALIDSDCSLSENTIVLFSSVISRDVKIAKPSFISASCTIKGSVSINASCFVGANVSIVKDINSPCFINAMTVVAEVINEPCVIYSNAQVKKVPLSQDKERAENILQRLGS